jgi:quinol monooxygenase YgiN
VLAAVRFDVPQEEGEAFLADARTALDALAAQRGHVRGWLARAVDDPRAWVLSTEWASVGAYRRALSAYEVKLHAHPLLYRAVDEPTAYEVVTTSGAGAVDDGGSARAGDADVVGLGEASTPHAPGWRARPDEGRSGGR